MQVKTPNRYRTEKPGSVSPHEISPSYGDQRTLDRVCRHALETIRQSADQATMWGCVTKATVGLRYLQAHIDVVYREAQKTLFTRVRGR